MAWRKSPPALIELFARVLPGDARVERRKMFGYPAAFLNGHLFAGLHQENLIIKLPPPDRRMLVEQYHARAFEPMPGRTMREYLLAPDTLLADETKLRAWLLHSMSYVDTLPPKPVKARKKGQTQAATAPERRLEPAASLAPEPAASPDPAAPSAA